MIDSIDEWVDFNKIYTSYFKPPYPARSAFEADGLALGAALELVCGCKTLGRQKSLFFTSRHINSALPAPLSRIGEVRL